jgi:hypothetical protein
MLNRKWEKEKKNLEPIEILDELGNSVGIINVPLDLDLSTFKSIIIYTR